MKKVIISGLIIISILFLSGCNIVITFIDAYSTVEPTPPVYWTPYPTDDVTPIPTHESTSIPTEEPTPDLTPEPTREPTVVPTPDIPPEAPVILVVMANDPDNLDTEYGNGDIIGFVFSEATNQPFGLEPGMAELDILFGPMNLGADYSGSWLAPDILTITINDATGGVAPIIGITTFTLREAGNLTNAAGTSVPSTCTSPPVEGSWGNSVAGAGTPIGYSQ